MQSTLLTANYGPRFLGWVGRTTDDDLICVAPRDYTHNPRIPTIMRELVARQGGDCTTCRGCPIGDLNGPQGDDRG